MAATTPEAVALQRQRKPRTRRPAPRRPRPAWMRRPSCQATVQIFTRSRSARRPARGGRRAPSRANT
ncbi:MAG: hypothetical protein B7733_11935 [Myxococcales bacterium FL481]|nr:MAG: hypothetical protein B7733_11935 [Myxococcales bacterium FL481]